VLHFLGPLQIGAFSSHILPSTYSTWPGGSCRTATPNQSRSSLYLYTVTYSFTGLKMTQVCLSRLINTLDTFYIGMERAVGHLRLR
jgi:hypothetical protein